jgi:hypothetical protein
MKVDDVMDHIELAEKFMNDLKPCPFCGSKGDLVYVEASDRKEVYVQCSHCAARGPSQVSLVTLQGKFVESVAPLCKKASLSWNYRPAVGRIVASSSIPNTRTGEQHEI